MGEVDVGTVVPADHLVVNRFISFVYQEYFHQALCTEGPALRIGMVGDHLSVIILSEKEC